MATGFKNKIISSAIIEDESGFTENFPRANNRTYPLDMNDAPPTSFTTRASKTVTVDNDNAVVVVVGFIVHSSRGGTNTHYAKMLDGSTTVISSVSNSVTISGVEPITIATVLTGVSAGSHTYNLQGKVSNTSFNEYFCSSVYVAVFNT